MIIQMEPNSHEFAYGKLSGPASAASFGSLKTPPISLDLRLPALLSTAK